MNLIKNKGTLLAVILGLLVSAASSQTGPSPEEDVASQATDSPDVASLKLQLQLLKNSYAQMCNHYTNLASNCSDVAVFKCTKCPDGWLHVGNQCFYLHTDRDNFFNSTIKCAENGAHLAILTTKEQHDAVEQEGRRVATLYKYYFIGLTDIKKEGNWTWVDKSPLTTPFWKEPDNSNDQPGRPTGGDCAVVDSYNQEWLNVPCDIKYPRVCQMDATPIK